MLEKFDKESFMSFYNKDKVVVEIAQEAKLLGGHSEMKDVDDEMLDIFTSYRDIVEAAAEETFDMFIPVKYTSQVVAGTVFNIKIQVGEDRFVHAKIVRPLPHTNEPASVMEGGIFKDHTSDSAFDL